MNIDVNYAIPLLGLIFISVGIYIRLGNLKQVYWKSRRNMVGYIPLGILFVVAGLYDFASKQEQLIFYAYIALLVIVIGLTLYFATRPPDFLKPDWIRWVEKYPTAVQKAMAADVDDNARWKQNITSEATVDAWAKQLARKLPKNK